MRWTVSRTRRARPWHAGSLRPLLLVSATAALWLTAGCTARAAEPGEAPAPVVRVGSKSFTESVILGEIVRLLADEAGATAQHTRRLGDTSKLWNGLLAGDLDVYCEYTGTLTQEVLEREQLPTDADLRRALARRGLRMSGSLGFSNNYALGMKEERAAELGVRTISDLRAHPRLRLGLSHPFLERGDGWRGLKRAYGLPQPTPKAMEHSLAYQALDAGTLDVVDLYTTDPQIVRYHLRVLEDDRKFFPAYDAVLLYRADLEGRAPQVLKALLRLQGAISADEMRAMNTRAHFDREPEAKVAADFLAGKFGGEFEVSVDTLPQRLLHTTGQHLWLVAVSLALAIASAVPLGVVAARRPWLGQGILALVGVVQTFPALALLSLLIVLLHYLRVRPAIGATPAIIALYLYSLLPVVRNTYTGLTDIPLQVRESAEALGLSPWARLRLVELPMASRAILAGVKTAAVINVGFATLGGLIGAGGYGQPIITGLDKNDTALILEGAIPAVLMALAVQGLFEVAERLLVPRGLRLKPAE
jgi:osmoprotectant transport system permease protein